MNSHAFCTRAAFAFLCLLPLPASAVINRAELAGNPVAQFPFFEYVRAFNVNAPVNIAIDPTRFPAIAGDICSIYVVAHKNPAAWASTPALVDVTPGGAVTHTFGGTNIQANTVVVAAASTLNANAGDGLGVGYDVVLDCDQNGSLSDGDFIDGLSDAAGLYMVHDTTAPGPHTVNQIDIMIPLAAGEEYEIPAEKLSERLYFPADIAGMGRLPLVVIGHGNGHHYTWYDHIGNHLASYGYIVISIDNDTGPGISAASYTQLGHTDAFLEQAQAGAFAGGQLVNHVDSQRIVWIGHSRGGEAVAVGYNRIFESTYLPKNFTKKSIRIISSMLPTDYEGTRSANPRDANYHLWTASGDTDMNGSAGDLCIWNTYLLEGCQTFHLVERAQGFRQSTVVQGTGHTWFHSYTGIADSRFTGPCPIGGAITHLVQLGYLLPLVKHYVEGNVPALDFLTRQYESFRPIGVPSADPCIVVSHEYLNGTGAGTWVIDDYQTGTTTNTSSSGGSVTFDVDNLTEGRLDDNNTTFVWDAADPFNGATQAGVDDVMTTRNDNSRGVVFDWTGADRFYEWEVTAGNRDFTRFAYLQFRGAQGTRHPNTIAAHGDLTFAVTLRDLSGNTSSINIGAFGGGLEEPFQRDGGWHNEMETIRIRLTDFINNGAPLNLTKVDAVRLSVGPASGSHEGRIVIDDLMLTNDVTPHTLRILEPTTLRPAYAGTSLVGTRVLIRLIGGSGLDMSPANLTILVDGVALTPLQIPTPPTAVSGETWVVIAPGPRADGCYELAVSVITPADTGTAEPRSLCYANDETHVFDRVLAIDQSNSMNFDGSTNLPSTAKMEAAKAAGRFFVDLSNPLDKIGVISFQRYDQDRSGIITVPDELAEPQFNFVEAGEGVTDQRPAARTAITGIFPQPSPGDHGWETSPGAGLVEASTMLNAGAVAGHKPNIVLITDGLENYPPFWNWAGSGGPLRPSFAARNIRIDTVGVGGDADDELLQDIATVTGGEFRNLNEGSGSFFLLSRLADFYKSVDEDVRGEQRFYHREGFPNASVPIQDKTWRWATFDVEAGLDWMTVAFHANLDSAYEVRLFAPGSMTPIAATPPTTTMRADSKHVVYRIRTPAAGQWRYLVDVRNRDAEFFAVASALTSLTAKIGPDQLAQRPSGDYLMPLRLWIAERVSVLGASVIGYVRQPNGVKVPVTLVDNGLSMDGAANDGVYGLPFVATIPGAHYVHLVATGTAPSGVAFTRPASTSFILPGASKRENPPGEDGRPPRPGCSCETETHYSLAAYGGMTFPRGSFGSVADSSTSFGLKVARHFAALGGRASLGLYAGRDDFDNASTGGDFDITHFSPELEIWPWARCPKPSLHVGVGSYRDENGNTDVGFNVGAGLFVCMTKRASLLGRYDYRKINGFGRDYSTLQLGLRWNF